MSARVNLMDPAVRASPYPHYAALRRNSPVCQVDPGNLWAATRYDDVMTVLKNPQLYSSEGFRAAFLKPWLTYNPLAESLVFQDPPKHTQLRSLVNRAFTPTTLERLEPVLRAFSEQLVTDMLARGSVDFVDAFALPVSATAICGLLGLDASLRRNFKRWSDDLADIGTIAADDLARQEQVRTTIREMESYLSEVLEAGRREPREDMVGELLRAQVDGQALSPQELMAFFFILLAAGLETTIQLLGHSARVLIDQPELGERVRADRSLLPRFIEEMLRYEPPAHSVMRITTADTTLGGVALPKGSMVLVLIGSATHDETRYPDPERFNLDRPVPQNLPFGHGIHFCIGAPLARLEARVALDVLLSRCRLSRGDAPLEWNYTMTVRGPKVLPVKVHPV
jgi:cytochrome P450